MARWARKWALQKSVMTLVSEFLDGGVLASH